MPVQRLTRLTLLAALCLVIRYAFSSFYNIQPVTAIFLVWSLWVSWYEGFLLMVVTMVVGGILLGFGPWVFLQLVSFTLALFVFRLLCLSNLKNFLFYQVFSAGLVAFLYGIMIDTLSALMYGVVWWSFVVNGLWFDINHAMATICFYPLIFTSLKRLDVLHV